MRSSQQALAVTAKPRSESQTVSAVGDQAALALENARLYQEAQRAYQELAATQAQLVRSETLRAVGALAAGAAHHLNNLLQVVTGRLELALSQCDSQGIQCQLIPALRAARDGAQVVKGLKSFSGTGPTPPLVPVDLNDLAEAALESTRPRWQNEAEERGVRIDVGLERGLIPQVAVAPSGVRYPTRGRGWLLRSSAACWSRFSRRKARSVPASGSVRTMESSIGMVGT